MSEAYVCEGSFLTLTDGSTLSVRKIAGVNVFRTGSFSILFRSGQAEELLWIDFSTNVPRVQSGDRPGKDMVSSYCPHRDISKVWLPVVRSRPLSEVCHALDA